MIDAEVAARFAGRRVLVTGGLGFLGSSIAHALVGLGARVSLIDALVPEQGGRRSNIDGIENDVEVAIGDLRDERLVDSLVRKQEVIFNLAGQTSHLDSMSDPLTDLEYNCRSQLSLLEACRRHNPAVRIVFASSRQLYGRPRYLPVDERHPIVPVDVNGIHKSAGEWYHLLYGQVYGLPVSVLRLTNTYGPRMRVRDARQTFLGMWLRLVLTGEQFVVLGDGTQRRDFTYVDDAVRAFLLVAGSDETVGEVYNVGEETSVSLRELAELLVSLNGDGSWRLEPFPPERERIDIGDYYADCAKIRSEVGWQPLVALEEGLRRTFDFYRRRGPAYWTDIA